MIGEQNPIALSQRHIKQLIRRLRQPKQRNLKTRSGVRCSLILPAIVTCCVTCGYFLFLDNVHALRVENTVWGNEEINDPLIEKLLDSKIMVRLKHIDQSGPGPYLGSLPKFSRYEHSVGVWALLRKSGASQKEQVAGLLHDSSHTAFSHVADYFFNKNDGNSSYQDGIHLTYLLNANVEDLLKGTDITIDDLSPDLPEYKKLEQRLPNLCADRIQYNIQTGIIMGLIEHNDAKKFIDHLYFKNDRWFFDDPAIAKKFANLSLYFTKNLWGSEWNFVLYHNFTDALQRAIDIGLLSEEDFRYGTDQDLLDKMHTSKDIKLIDLLQRCKRNDKAFSIVSYANSDIHCKPKFRGIDPLVCNGDTCNTLTEIDQDFKMHYEGVYQWCQRGYGIILNNVSDGNAIGNSELANPSS